MDDLIRRSDALKELWYPFDFTRTEIDMNIQHIPAVDAVEVVRCPSCRYHTDDGYHECIKLGIRIPDDAEFFCKYGKPK